MQECRHIVKIRSVAEECLLKLWPTVNNLVAPASSIVWENWRADPQLVAGASSFATGYVSRAGRRTCKRVLICQADLDNKPEFDRTLAYRWIAQEPGQRWG